MPHGPEVLAGKVALVTGGGRGIGRAIASVFARAGASVVIADVSEARGEATMRAIRDAGWRAVFVRTDLRHEPDIEAMVQCARDTFRRLDILVNNARPQLRPLPFAESLEEWDLAMDVLLKAPAWAAKYALPELRKAGAGSIVNILSISARFVSQQPMTYHVAKAGLWQLTRCLAYELGPHGIRVNAICPALVDLHDDDRTPLTADPVNRTIAEIAVPLGRPATAEEIAAATLFVCSAAAAYMTGHVLILDGGLTLGDQFHVARRAFWRASGGA